MNCPTCGAAYEAIMAMGQVAPVAHIATCSCPTTGSGSVPGSFQWTAPPHYSSTSGPFGRTTPFIAPTPTPPAPPAPEEPLRPAGEIVDDLRDLLDELDDE